MESSSNLGRGIRPEHAALGREWKRLSRAATVVAVLTSPAFLLFLVDQSDWPLGWALIGTFFAVIAFRGLIDVVAHMLIPRPSMYGGDKDDLLDDAVARRRVWYWRGKFRFLLWVGGILLVVWTALALMLGETFGQTLHDIGNGIVAILPLLVGFGIQLPLFFIMNLVILFGPLLFFGLKQMKGYEPGDADWGVRLEDVRGQKEPKQEVTRVIELWQSGEEFRKAGGKPERGLLFIGAPGTGKTMLSKAIATSFNSPIVTMPGSGFAQTFIGLDVIVVMFLIRKARKLASKWGGQCIIFIDEIDAVGLRRQALGGGPTFGGMTPPPAPRTRAELGFYGPWGARNSSQDIVIETPEWRDWMFAQRRDAPLAVYPPAVQAAQERIANFFFPGGMGGGGMGGGMALNQLLVQMDGVDEPRFWRKFWTNRINTFLDATYVIPRKIGGKSVRLPAPPPRSEQVYFIGATNVPIDRLDPALIRPGRMGRHIWFRTPTKDDRRDIFDLYLDKVSHVADLATDKRRDELARVTNGYSPAMIEQVCSMALTYAHSDGRDAFEWSDMVEAITTIESGTAQNIEYLPAQSRATAIHEAGHVVTSHLYLDNIEHTRLSIRKRGSSLGHYQGKMREERLAGGEFRHEEVGDLVLTLGAMAAEHTFYAENSTGVGGDVNSATRAAAWMVGMCAMGPEPVDLTGRVPSEGQEEAEERIMTRFERIGLQIMNRADGNPLQADSLSSVLMDPYKREAAARLLGQAYMTALCCIRHNRDAVLQVAEVLIERKELYGDEVTELLQSVALEAPPIDVLDPSIWPKVV